MILVDTTIWSVAYRRKRQDLSEHELRARRVLEEAILADEAALLGMVRRELLSGIRDEIRYRRVRDDVRFFPDVQLTFENHEEAARMSNICCAKGIAGNPIDFLICAVSHSHNWPILTLDRDFIGYASCLPLEIHPASAF